MSKKKHKTTIAVEPEVIEAQPVSGITMTQKDYDGLKSQLDVMRKETRPAIVERMTEARAQGDLSENAEYAAARDELRSLDGKIGDIEVALANAVIVDVIPTDGSVGIGTVVTCEESDTGNEVKYEITSTVDCDVLNDKISDISPAGSALLHHREGDIVEVKCPKGYSYWLTIKGVTLA